jgi:hypothetical protein
MQVEQATLGCKIVAQVACFEHLVQETSEGDVLVDRMPSEFSSIEEAVQSIKRCRLEQSIGSSIREEAYNQLSASVIAEAITTHHGNVRVSDTLIESYVELAASKLFTVDPVAFDIRNHNKLDRLIESRIDYKLNDGSVIAISEDTQSRLNSLFRSHPDVIEYMRESVDNFLDVLNQVEE